MTEGKTQWTRPQLIVLAKGTPEESVLTVCKAINAGSGPTATQQTNCQDVNSPSVCGACQARPGGAS
ncbi:MAG TPA: hypothetical protein VGA61_15080 [Anaerolineae bacterium]